MIVVDFETRSLADLQSVGGRAYVRDPSTELLCATAVDTRTDPARVYCWSGWLDPSVGMSISIRKWEVPPEDLRAIGFDPDGIEWVTPTADLPEEIAQAARDGVLFVAQNADAFDSVVWDALGYPPARWADTLPLFSRRGLPRGLENVSQILYGVGKDALGQKLMRASCIPQKKGPLKGQWVPPDSARLSRIARYCARDSLIAAAVWFDEELGKPDHDDPVLRMHRKINARGIPVDVHAAQKLRAEDIRQQAIAVQQAEKATNGEVTMSVLSSPLQFRKWLAKQGVKTIDAARQTMEAELWRLDNAPDWAKKVKNPKKVKVAIEGRLAISRVTQKKVEAILNRVCPDQRLRDWAVYYGAHTGRFSSRGVQTQNFATQKVKVFEDVYDEPSQAVAVAIEEEITIADVFGSMLRGLFMAPPEFEGLGVIDLSGIEARVTAWCAQDWEDLDVYVRKDDPYILLANKVFGAKPGEITKKDFRRQAGKVGVLACGYQGGPNAINKMCAKMKIDLAAAGTSAEKVVDAWRDAHPLVAGTRKGIWKTPEGRVVVTRRGGLWRDTKDVVDAIAQRKTTEGHACRSDWYREGDHLYCRLPSGRLLIYRDIAWEKVPNLWGGESESTTYLSARGFRIPTYGGKLVENVVQAICRDILTDAALELEANDLPIFLHVHDEVVFGCKNQESYDLGMKIITRTPPWMPRMVVGADGHMGRRYSKPS